MQKLKLNLITTTFISLFCLLSILSFGQNTKNTAPKLNAANSKNTGMRINHNANATEVENTAKPVQKLWGQGEIGNSDESFAKLWKNEPFGEQNIAKELVEKRDAYAKHFANDDGSISAHIASGPIHYKEKNEWKTIFHTITPTANGFENIHNSHKTYYPASATESLTTVLENGEVLRDMINMNMYFSVNGEKVHLKTIQDNKGRADFNQLTYPNAYGNGIDLQLTHETTKRKMDYVIHNREAIGDIPNNASHLVFEETIELPIGWNAELKDNIIYIKDGKGEIQVLYEKPFLEDSPNFDKLPKENITEKDSKDLKSEDIRKINLRDEGEYSIKQNGNLLTIQTAVTIDWITSEERQFPVKVDPTVNVYPMADWTGQMGSSGVGAYGTIAVGYNGGYYRSYAKFDISSITDGSTVSSTILYHNVGFTSNMSTLRGSEIRAFLDDPDASYYSTWSSLYNAVINSTVSPLIYQTVTHLGTLGWKNVTLGTNANTHLQNRLSLDNFTIGYRPSGTYNGTVQNALLYGSDHSNKPYLSVTYTIPSGPPSCASPISPLAGASGTAHSGNVEWQAVGGADTYDVYFGTSATPPQVATDQVATTYPLDCLLPETTYYWKVVPKNGDGSATGCPTWSFTTDNKLHIYKNDWETANTGFFGTSGASVDGWYANSTDGMSYDYDYYQNIWTVGTGTNAISGKSVGVSGLKNGSLAGDYFDYWTDLGTLYRWIYRPINLTGLRDVELTFRWKGEGESSQDFGTVATSINGGNNWLTDEQGGLYSNGQYYNSHSTIRTQTLTFPDTRNNQNNFQLAFKWNDLSGNGYGGSSTFVIDDIVMKACPYEGTLSSPNQTEPFAWSPPTANTQTTITVNGTHQCAYFEWEQSIDNGTTWSIISGANSVSYTTPSNLTANTFYRCRVYFGSGCPGAYQDEAFKIVFSPDCTTEIAPADGSSNQSTSIHLSWNPDPLATSYNVYFGQNYPPTTMVGNTANQYYDVDNLDYNTTYYWQILPTNAGGTASGCDVWSFTTGAASPQFHNYGGTEQLTFDNSAYKADAPNFRISHPSTMEEVQIQISQDVSFPGTTVYDGNFTGSFTGENNFETALSGEVLNESYFPQTFDTDVLTHGTNPSATNIWFAPEYYAPISWTSSGGNPGGRVGYSGSANWSNFLRTPAINCTGQDLVTLTFDVWHSENTSNWIKFNQWADDGYKNNVVSVKINGEDVTYIYGTGKGFQFSEQRATAQVEVIFDISAISDKSNIQFYFNAICNHGSAFYVYFDNISITGADQEFTPGTTYYARTRGKIGGNWTDWTTKTHSFTYKNQTDIEWYQNMEPQFLTDERSGVITQTSPDFVTIPEASGTPTNPFINPSFETSSGWNTYKTGGSQLVITLPDGNNWKSDGTKAARMYMYGGYAMSSDIAIISQVVDLTSVEQIIFDAQSHYGQNMFSNLPNGGTLRLIIGGSSSDASGTVYKTIYHCVSGSSSCSVASLDNTVTVNPANRATNQLVKFVWTGFTQGDLGGALVSFMVDNIRVGVDAVEDGTLTSTPINLSSFYGDDSWHELSWNQALNGGSIAMSIEEDNGGTWTPVAGFTNITQTGDGVKTVDISSLSSISRIRVIAKFSETGAKGTQPELNNWIIKTKKDEPLPVELLYFNVKCNGSDKEFSWVTASETNSDYFLIMASEDTRNFKPVAKIQAAGYSSQNIEYTYTLKGLNNKVYYRLQQIDFDGNSETFQIIYADCNKMSNFEITAYPNPFDGKILYLNSTSTLKNAVINIYDALGRLVYQTNRNEINSHTEIKIDSQLEPGAYYLEISSKNELNKRISIIVK
ncbi:MAG: T9SS type A sorting domain-containing protein [Bacteroidales bacterium]|nr:T9SS type A sorting domain-containing protein [Bacteroidales bacterium]